MIYLWRTIESDMNWACIVSLSPVINRKLHRRQRIMKPFFLTTYSLFIFFFLGCYSHSAPEVKLTTGINSEKSTFPNQTWRYLSKQDSQWSSEKLNEAHEMFDHIGGQSMFIVYRGYVVQAWGDYTKNVEARSIRKSLLNGLFGQIDSLEISNTLEDLNIDDKLGLSKTEKNATIEHLLSTSSGIMHPAAYTPPVRDRAKRHALKPGQQFEYNNWDFNALSTIYNKVSKSDLFKDFEHNIAEPLGMQDFDKRNTQYYYEKKSNHPAYLFSISARDLARYGLLYLNYGVWNETTVVDSSWISTSTSKHYSTPSKFKGSTNGYGYLWWTYDWRFNNEIIKPAFAARGTGGQFLFVCPEMNTVVVFRSEPGGWLKKIIGKRVEIEDSYRLLSKVLSAHPDLN